MNRSSSRPSTIAVTRSSSSNELPGRGVLLARTCASTRPGPVIRSTSTSTLPPLSRRPSRRAGITRVSLKTTRSPASTSSGNRLNMQSSTASAAAAMHSRRLSLRPGAGCVATSSGGRSKLKSERRMARDVSTAGRPRCPACPSEWMPYTRPRLELRECFQAGVVKLVDALDSKSSGGNPMRVRFPPSAPSSRHRYPALRCQRPVGTSHANISDASNRPNIRARSSAGLSALENLSCSDLLAGNFTGRTSLRKRRSAPDRRSPAHLPRPGQLLQRRSP